MTQKYNIEGMTCNGCRTRVENALKELDPNAEVVLETHEATVDESITKEAVEKAVENAGYKVK